jgi:iron complex outermembrane receptor protein
VILLLTILTSSSVAAATVQAQAQHTSQLPALKQLSIEELLELDVTLPLRRDDRVMDAPAAIGLLTNEDLRRQGAVSLAEALRHANALYVGRFTASSWIVSSRGFASTSANKLLVMIDGRSVYSPLFSGVFWNQQDALLSDLDRIEVIRGPGASLWGSNAVNGVINVVSKRAAETQGFQASLGGGAEERLFSAARYGGRVGSGHYRVYGKFFDRDDAKLANGLGAEDGQRFAQAGFRADSAPATLAFTLQGDAYRTRGDTTTAADVEADGANVLARLTHRSSPRSELQLQTYFDWTRREVPNQTAETRRTVDIDVQQQFSAHARHALNMGASYRLSSDETTPSAVLVFDPDARTTHLVTAFVQDEVTLTPTLSLIGGVKVEHNDYTGVEWQPSVRARWMPTSRNTIWGAVSRAVRMPTRFDTDIRVYQGPLLLATGNPDFRSEELVAFEAGYRTMAHPAIAIDLTAFYNRYDDLRSQEVRGGRIDVDNLLNDGSAGANITATVQPRAWARLTGSYTRLTHDLSLDPGSTDLYQGQFETIDPEHMARVQARFDLPRGFEVDVTTLYVGALPQVVRHIPGTPSYTEAGFRVGWRITPQVEISLIGRDVLHDEHVEFISPTSSRVTWLERALFTRLALAF